MVRRKSNHTGVDGHRRPFVLMCGTRVQRYYNGCGSKQMQSTGNLVSDNLKYPCSPHAEVENGSSVPCR